jgi:tetratricopeptide (TPR) repeat protein
MAAVPHDLGSLYQAMGDYARAEPLLRRALETKRKTVGEEHPDYATSLSNLAGLYWAMGDSVRAEPWLREALEIETALINDTAPALGARPRMELLGSMKASLDGYLDIAQQTGAGPEALYRRVLNWKGAGDAGRGDDRLVRDRPELKPVLEELTSVRARLAHLAFTTPAPAQRMAWREQLDTLRERKEDLEAELGRRSATDRAGKPSKGIGPEEVAAALPLGTALVDLIASTGVRPMARPYVPRVRLSATPYAWTLVGVFQKERILKQLEPVRFLPSEIDACLGGNGRLHAG